MSAHLTAVEVKRARLLERAAREREDLAQTLQLWAQPLGFADRCLAALDFVLSRPPLLAAAVTLLVVARPRRAFTWARRAFGAWRTYRWLTRKAAI
jgi:hypothetical protein